MPRSLRVAFVAAAIAAVLPLPGRGEDPPAAAVAEPTATPATAADGTVSVVAPAAEPDAPGSIAPPAAVPDVSDGAAAPPLDEVSDARADDQASSAAPPAEVHALPAAEAASLLAAVLAPPDSGPAAALAVASRPLTLFEALQRPGDPSRRLWIAQAYWKVTMAAAWVRWAGEAVERLELVAPGGDPHDRAVLDVATAAARADFAEARSQLGIAQQELVDLARLPIADPLPWPVDRPLSSPYQTHFDAIFATRIATGRTRAIARTLPARHEALEARAAAVTAAGTAAAMAEADHAKGRRPIEAVIAAHAALVGQQREFLAAVRAYNLDIAEYAMAVADLAVPDDRFVTMLIGAPTATRPATPP